MRVRHSSTTSRTRFQVSGCNRRLSFSAAFFYSFHINAWSLCTMLANIISRHARRLLVHRQCLDVSLPRCVLPLLPLSLPPPLLLCTREPTSCGVTKTSFLAPISPLMTQRQFKDRLPRIKCVSFQTQTGWCLVKRVVVTCCFTITFASSVWLVRTTTVQPHSLPAPGPTCRSPRK